MKKAVIIFLLMLYSVIVRADQNPEAWPDSVFSNIAGSVFMYGFDGTTPYIPYVDSSGNFRISTVLSGEVEATQPTHDDLNCNANIQVNDTDVSDSNAMPIKNGDDAFTGEAHLFFDGGAVTALNPLPTTASITPGVLSGITTSQDMGAGPLSFTTSVADDWDLSFFLIHADGIMSEEVNFYLDSKYGSNFDVLLQTVTFSGEADYIWHYSDGEMRLENGDEIKVTCTHNTDSIARTLYILFRAVR